MGWIPLPGDGAGEYINAVRDHSATGDGTTDDTSALQAAVDAAETIISGTPEGQTVTLYIPAGIYMVSRLDIAESGLQLLMDPETVLRRIPDSYSPGDGEGVINVHGTAEDRISRVFIQGGVVDGNKADVTSDDDLNLECVSTKYADDCHYVDVKAINSYSDGFDFDESADCTVTRGWAEDCGGWGFHQSIASTRIRLIDCEAVNCGHDWNRGGFDQYHGAQTHATDCTYLRCRAVDCYQNFDIGSTGAHIGAIRSEGTTTEADSFAGVSVDMDEAGSLDLDDLDDVDLTGLSVGDFLRWDGDDWVPDVADSSDVHRLVVLVDDGAGGVQPLTDDDGLWLYGAYPGTEH